MSHWVPKLSSVTIKPDSANAIMGSQADDVMSVYLDTMVFLTVDVASVTGWLTSVTRLLESV